MNTMTYKGYQGKFEYDQDADIFHGKVGTLNDVAPFKSRSLDELKKHWLIQWKIICRSAKKSLKSRKEGILASLHEAFQILPLL